MGKADSLFLGLGGNGVIEKTTKKLLTKKLRSRCGSWTGGGAGAGSRPEIWGERERGGEGERRL